MLGKNKYIKIETKNAIEKQIETSTLMTTQMCLTTILSKRIFVMLKPNQHQPTKIVETRKVCFLPSSDSISTSFIQFFFVFVLLKVTND